MRNNELSIVIIGYDKYSDVWSYFDYFFNLYWQDCNYRKIFISNEIKGPASFDSFVAKDASAYERFRCALENSDSDYFLVLLEDYCPSAKVDSSLIEQLLKDMKENNLDYLQLTNFICKTKGQKTIVKKQFRINEIKKSLNYRVSLQPAIWTRELLEKVLTLKPNTLWDFENLIRENSSFSENEIKAGYTPRSSLSICNFVDKGLITLEAKRIIDANKLEQPKRKIIDKKANFRIKLKRFIISIIPNAWLVRYLKRRRKS